MQHKDLHARRKHHRNKLCKEDFLHKSTTVVTISGYYSTAGRSTAGSIICTHMGVVCLMNIKMLHYALLYLITLVCQINQTSLLQCHIWVLSLLLHQGIRAISPLKCHFQWLLNQGITHCICLVSSQPLFHQTAPCAGESPRVPMVWVPREVRALSSSCRATRGLYSTKGLAAKAICYPCTTQLQSRQQSPCCTGCCTSPCTLFSKSCSNTCKSEKKFKRIPIFLNVL